ncbi:hypothetical protein H5J25_19180 (plasmid) [Sphingomonas aliaeris]|uniref:Uncharacterized protein n=1 Tax=Sphingomonas aliaeris TaxID=2759526 RepID=A0A974NYK3_9SPHN|nr:hypothetical protein [Sphingomonas aliaeris]QQV79188.1 hypothetical protein H5J25_19180 [Sphingomonas aliaeris]
MDRPIRIIVTLMPVVIRLFVAMLDRRYVARIIVVDGRAVPPRQRSEAEHGDEGQHGSQKR